MGTKQIQVSGELWQQVCTVGWRGTFECTEGLPEGATLCGVSYKQDWQFYEAGPKIVHVVVFIFEHPDWPEIKPGEDAPVIDVAWEMIRDAPESQSA